MQTIRSIRVSRISTGRNPRSSFGEAGLRELARSIGASGVLVPLIVRPDGGKAWRLVAGERRLRAAKLAGLREVPCVVMDLDDAAAMEAQLLENLQREDLGALDEAAGFKAYLGATGRTQAQLAAKIGKTQAYVSNRVRLLDLPERVRADISRGIIGPSHGEVLLKLPTDGLRAELYREAAEDRDLYYGGPSETVKELDARVDQVLDGLRRKEEFRKSLEDVRFRDCPACKKPAERKGWRGKNSLVCPDYHAWDGRTGKPTGGPSHASAERSAPRPRPKVPAVVRSFATPDRWARELLASVPEGLIGQVSVFGGTRSGRLEIAIKKNPFKFAFVAEPHKYTTGEACTVHLDAHDDRKRREMGEGVRKFEGRMKNLRRARRKGARADPSVLKGPIADAVGKLPDDPELLEQLRDAEVRGRNRAGILDAIDLRLGV